MFDLRAFSLFLFIGLLLAACSPQSTTLSVATLLPSPTSDSYSLDWHIAADEVIAYTTVMSRIESADTAVSLNFDELAADDTQLSDVLQQLGNLSAPQSTSMVSLLEVNQRGNIDVKLILTSVEFSSDQSQNPVDEGMRQLTEQMQGTVQLRGEITPDGEIASFYLEQHQRNLLAMFFELPTVPVQVGDTWELDFNCVSFGAGFVADNANKLNRVEFASLSQTPDGKPIASLNYLLAENVEGHFQSSLGGEPMPTTMTCSFFGTGQFLIEEGRWQQFVGEFTLTSTGLMTSNNVQHFALMPLADIPQALLALE